MKSPSQMSKTAVLVESALMIALSFVLSTIPFIQLPWGGTVTCFSTMPIIIFSLRHGTKYGLAAATIYAFLQMMQGMGSVVLAKTPALMFLCALLDYILAYTCLGLTSFFAGLIKKPTIGMVFGICITGLMRLAFSFLSGLLIWSAWAPEGMPVWQYSLTYNAGWCLPDVAIVLAACLVLSRVKALSLLPNASYLKTETQN